MTSTAIGRNLELAHSLLSVSNLLTTLERATPEDWTEGLAWYDTAHSEAVDLADTFGLPVDTCAGIIAALSPQQQWDVNLAQARVFIASKGTASVHFSLCVNRARAILNDPSADPLSILGGPKVRSFYRNIAEPQTPGPVTIDRHAVAILHGTDTPYFLSTYPKLLDRKAIYRIATGYYRCAARLYSEHNNTTYHPHQIQAVAWVAHRNTEFVEEF